MRNHNNIPLSPGPYRYCCTTNNTDWYIFYQSSIQGDASRQINALHLEGDQLLPFILAIFQACVCRGRPTNRTPCPLNLGSRTYVYLPCRSADDASIESRLPGSNILRASQPGGAITQAPTTRSKWSPRTHRGRSGILSPARISFIEVPISNARKTRKQDTPSRAQTEQLGRID